MSSQWSYLVVVLCFSVTSSAVLDRPGNTANCHGDELSDVRKEETLTPPTVVKTSKNLITQYLNEAICRELCKNGDGGNACLCDWPPLKKEIFFSLKDNARENPPEFIRFPTIESEPVCKILCANGDEGHFCLCNKITASP